MCYLRQRRLIFSTCFGDSPEAGMKKPPRKAAAAKIGRPTRRSCALADRDQCSKSIVYGLRVGKCDRQIRIEEHYVISASKCFCRARALLSQYELQPADAARRTFRFPQIRLRAFADSPSPSFGPTQKRFHPSLFQFVDRDAA